MQDKNLRVYPTLDTIPPLIPERSLLYYVEPISIGTPYCESLISYLYRLSYKHSISLQCLISVILKRKWRKTKKQIFYDSVFVSQIVSTLESMTGNRDLKSLTLLVWLQVFHFSFLHEHYQKWCPLCYEEWQQNGQPIYLPLLWIIDLVSLCPRHNSFLINKCHACDASFEILTVQIRTGHCPQCNSWLGLTQSISSKTSLDLKKDPSWEKYINSNLCQLIVASSRLNQSIEKQRLSDVLRAFLRFNDLTVGKFYRATSFQQVTNISERSLQSYSSLKQIPTLERLLGITFYFNISLLDFLTEDIDSLVHKMTVY